MNYELLNLTLRKAKRDYYLGFAANKKENVMNEKRTAYQTAFLDYLCDTLDIGSVSREALDLLEAEFGRCYHAGYAAGMFYDTPEDNPKRHDNKCYSDDNLKG